MPDADAAKQVLVLASGAGQQVNLASCKLETLRSGEHEAAAAYFLHIVERIEPVVDIDPRVDARETSCAAFELDCQMRVPDGPDVQVLDLGSAHGKLCGQWAMRWQGESKTESHSGARCVSHSVECWCHRQRQGRWGIE